MINSPSRSRLGGFTLIELIVVVGIIVTLSALAMPALNTVLKGSNLTQSASTLTAQISGARQQALSRNKPVEVRFYMYADPNLPGEVDTDEETWKFHAIQVFEISETGVAFALAKVQRFPVGVVLSRTALSAPEFYEEGSTRRLEPNRKTDPQIVPPKKGGSAKDGYTYKYVAFRFQPDGSTNLPPTRSWYVTLHAETDTAKIEDSKNPSGVKAPPNFFTLQVDPVSGTTRAYRPAAG